MTDVLKEEVKFGHRQKDAQGESHVTTEAEIGVLQLESKEQNRLLATTRHSKRKGSSLEPLEPDFRPLTSE